MVFSNTTDRTGIIELLEDLTNTQSATTSSYPLKTKTRDINNAYADYFRISTDSSGTWQGDDTNQVDYPVITTNIVSGQQDYSFTTDEQGNQILDIYRVECKDANGVWQLLASYDENTETTSLSSQELLTGTPTRYYKTANGIFLDRKPSYNSTGGLKIYYARTPAYFVSTDTTKKPGFPDVFHTYLAFRPAYMYCVAKGLQQANAYRIELDRLELSIKTYYSMRTRDEKPRLTVKQESNR